MSYTAVGSPVVARRMISDNGLFGGEENGGLIFADHQYCRDGAMAAARMIEAIVKMGPLQDQIDTLPRYCTVKEAVMCTEAVKPLIVGRMAERHRDLRPNTVDGLRIDYEDGWVLLRPSGTEPKFRIYSESKDPEVARSRARMFKDIFYCAEVTSCKVYNVDIISYACSVNSIVVIAENAEALELADCYLCYVRHKVIGYAVGVLAEKSAFVCADRVEVTEK